MNLNSWELEFHLVALFINREEFKVLTINILNFQKEYKKNQGRLEMTELNKKYLRLFPWK